jgi:putative oxidoreductase
MATLTMPRQESYEHARESIIDLAAPIGRILFGLMFVIGSLAHFHGETVALAYANGVPAPEILVPLSGWIELVGGMSILLGFKARWGALLLIAFLIPDSFVMHHYWSLNGAAADIQREMFVKNLGLLGGAMLVLYVGSGPHSLDNFKLKNYRRTRSAI